MFHLPTFLKRAHQNDCGVVALEIIARHYGTSTRYQDLRDLVDIDGAGANLLTLLNAANNIGFSSKGMKGSYDALKNIPLPAIAHITIEETIGHFVVLNKWDPKSVTISDRNEGTQSLSRYEFCSCWTGYLLVVAPRQPIK